MTSKLMNFSSIAVASLLVGLGIACSFFDAAPSECVKAAEDAGLPDRVVDQLREPDGLSAIERAALQRLLVKSGIDDVCETSQEQSGSSDPVTDGLNPIAKIGTFDNEGLSRSSETEKDDVSGIGVPSVLENDQVFDKKGQSESSKTGKDDAPGVSTPSVLEDDRVFDEEHLRRCDFWALNNLDPIVYMQFADLDPNTMDDLDRALWRSKLNPEGSLGYYPASTGTETGSNMFPRKPGVYCRDYWTEPLNETNADLRNEEFESGCRSGLGKAIIRRYDRLQDWANTAPEKGLIYRTPNQYARIMGWLEMSGNDLLDAENPPYRILEDQSRHQHAYFFDWLPTDEKLNLYRGYGLGVDLEWVEIVKAAGLSGESGGACARYYPQLFYGRWIPFDPDQAGKVKQHNVQKLPDFNETNTPIYLPKSVTAEKIPLGYPLGQTSKGYLLCVNHTSTQQVGYYYVNHPAGGYCELER